MNPVAVPKSNGGGDEPEILLGVGVAVEAVAEAYIGIVGKPLGNGTLQLEVGSVVETPALVVALAEAIGNVGL